MLLCFVLNIKAFYIEINHSFKIEIKVQPYSKMFSVDSLIYCLITAIAAKVQFTLLNKVDHFLISVATCVICVLFSVCYIAPGICPPGWILWNKMCYYFANDLTSSKLSWYDARTACQKIRGGDLVSILSAAENSFIKSRIAS